MRVAILTASDRAAAGEREDASGPAIRAVVEGQDWQVTQAAVIPDDYETIRATLAAWADADLADLILTTGGTGFAPRDVTPEATRAVIERETPGLPEAMRAASLALTQYAMLSRQAAGIRRRTLIVNLPGSPKAVREHLAVILPVLPHAVALLRGDPAAEDGHRTV
ncbi:MAG: MogA/MoaB family molybdenum cofactor biosynthesis protein [Chloroflexi bacterium]|nr:MogA/MoaB family molybdenum cofactor biosynthesis protein [Chloroflexota bacterium]